MVATRSVCLLSDAPPPFACITHRFTLERRKRLDLRAQKKKGMNMPFFVQAIERIIQEPFSKKTQFITILYTGWHV